MQEIRCTNKNRSKEHFLERIFESHIGEKLKKGNWLRFKKGTFPKGIKLKQKVKKWKEWKKNENQKTKATFEEAFYFLLPKFILPILKQANFRQIVNAISNANFVIFFCFFVNFRIRKKKLMIQNRWSDLRSSDRRCLVLHRQNIFIIHIQNF